MYLILVLSLSLFINGLQSRVIHHPFHHAKGVGRLTKNTQENESIVIPTQEQDSNEMQDDKFIDLNDEKEELDNESSFEEDETVEEGENEEDVNEDSNERDLLDSTEEEFDEEELKDTNESGKDEFKENEIEGSLENYTSSGDLTMNLSGSGESLSNMESLEDDEDEFIYQENSNTNTTKEQTDESEYSQENDSEGSRKTSSLNQDVIEDEDKSIITYSSEVLDSDIDKVLYDTTLSTSPTETSEVRVESLPGSNTIDVKSKTKSGSPSLQNISSSTSFYLVNKLINEGAKASPSKYTSNRRCSNNGSRQVASGEAFNIFEICINNVWSRAHCPGISIFYTKIACCVHPFAFPCFDNCVIENP
uniref:Chitin-binding type-2 domain-containing protein n=1 Tax=Lepeophtheirus salmonis TaxID=72036 RepID=A0A0K2TYR3_LEPSM